MTEVKKITATQVKASMAYVTTKAPETLIKHALIVGQWHSETIPEKGMKNADKRKAIEKVFPEYWDNRTSGKCYRKHFSECRKLFLNWDKIEPVWSAHFSGIYSIGSILSKYKAFQNASAKEQEQEREREQLGMSKEEYEEHLKKKAKEAKAAANDSDRKNRVENYFDLAEKMPKEFIALMQDMDAAVTEARANKWFSEEQWTEIGVIAHSLATSVSTEYGKGRSAKVAASDK